MLRIGKAAFNGFLSSLVDRFPLFGQAVGIDLLFMFFPDMTGDGLYGLCVAGALAEKRTTDAEGWVGTIFTIPLSIGGAIDQNLTPWATVPIDLCIIDIVALVKTPLDVVGAAVADDAVDLSFFKPFANRSTHIASVQTDGGCLKPKALTLSVEALQVRKAVVNVARGHVSIGNQVMLPAGGAVIKIKEPFRFPISDHVAAVRIGGT